jgi:putative glutamine amidotransferase
LLAVPAKSGTAGEAVTNSPLIGISVGARQVDQGAPFLLVRTTYTHAVEAAGGAPVTIPLQLTGDALRRVYDRLDGLVFSGGGDMDPACYGVSEVSPYTVNVDPNRDEIEMQLIRWALEDNKPLLAICRGHQVLNVTLGGTLHQDIREEVPGALRHESPSAAWFNHLKHDVEVEPGSRLQTALGVDGPSVTVNSLHHQGIDRVASDLTVSARAADGIVEGLEIPENRFTVGVQWHPEALVDEHSAMRRLFQSLVEAAGGS